MRALLTLIVLILLAATVWFVVRRSDRLYCRLILNKARHEFLNGEEEKAIGRAIEVLNHRPNYQPALEAAILWLAGSKQFDRARVLARDYGAPLTLSPRVRYQLAICAYEKGEPKEVASLFETLTSPTKEGGEISTPLVTSYLAMARGDYETARMNLERVGPALETNLLYHSMFGRVCYAQREMARATEELDRAVQMGAQNRRTRLLLAVCKALKGDASAMERLLDQLAAEGHDAYGQAQAEIQTLLDRSRTDGRFIFSAQQAAQRDRTLNLHLALAAIKIRQNRSSEAHEILTRLGRDFPERVGVLARRAILHERQSRLDLALPLYQQEADRLFLAAYKTVVLATSPTVAQENAVLKRFLTTGSLVFDAAAMNPSAGSAARRGWALSSSGEVWQTFHVAASGRYAIDLVARGDPAGGVWPIVEFHMDGRIIADQYINSPVYDLFEIEAPLLAGTHFLRVIYVNNTVEPGLSGDRNLYLDRVIIRPEPN